MKTSKRNELRIIGGLWRSRKIFFPDVEGLRPTPDRVRETLFNWLKAEIVGAHCLDLFSGSGALSFEALSRGAGKAVLVEEDKDAFECIQQSAATLQAKKLEMHQQDCLVFLKNEQRNSSPFDIIFVDPPYAKKLLPTCFKLIDIHHWLKQSGLIYFESETPITEQDLPNTWKILKAKRAGNVYYHLVQKQETVV